MNANRNQKTKYLWLTLVAFALGSATFVMLIKGIHALVFVVWAFMCVLTLALVWKLIQRVPGPRVSKRLPQADIEQKLPACHPEPPVAPNPQVEWQSGTSDPTTIPQKRPRIPLSKQSPVSGSEVP